MSCKNVVLLFLLLACTAVMNAEIPAGYKASGEKGGVIFSDDFSSGLGSWKEASGLKVFQVVPGTGDNGSPGLVYERKDANEPYGLLQYFFESVPGRRYRARVMVKAENIQDLVYPPPKNRLFAICAEYYDKNGKWMTGTYPVIKLGEKTELPWTEAAVEFPVPPGGVKTAVSLYFRNGKVSGKVTYDNFILEQLGNQDAVIYPVVPKQFRLEPDGSMEFRIFDYADRPEKDLKFCVQVQDKNLFFPVQNGMAKVKVPAPDSGKLPVEVYLLDEKTKTVGGHEKYVFTVGGKETPPEGAVVTDRQGRIKVDGKYFLPVGIFSGYNMRTEPELKRLHDAGFNAVMPYFSMKMSAFGGQLKTTPALMKNLDALHRHGIKIMFDLMSQVRGGVYQFDDVKGNLNVAEHVCRTVCRHPAILSWYLTDENQPGDLPIVKRLRQTLSTIDPYHPVLTLTNIPSNHIVFGPTGDILMADRYPIRGKESRSMGDIRRHFISGIGNAKMGMWFVPQTFHWGAYQKPWSKFRYPTEEEMRSMVLLAMNMGAKGYCFYSHSPIFNQQEKHDPGSSKWFWPQVANVAKLLRELEDFFFTDDVQPVSCNLEGKNPVEAKLYRSGKKTCVVITCDGPGKAKAGFRIPGNLKLKSRYGHTVRLEDGSYEFTGNDIGSDVLTDY